MQPNPLQLPLPPLPRRCSGFPWMARLRYLMERADDIESAMTLWNATQNTVGFNHGIGSAKDRRFVVLETSANRTALFSDMDPREAAATYADKNGSSVQIGYPVRDAVWRTNNPFDPVMRENFLWSQAPGSDSQHRYRIIHGAIMDVEATGVPATVTDMVNITAVVGTKGDDFYNCGGFPHGGENVLSVAFDPESLVLYSAWEAGSGDKWIPAACSTYVRLDMKQYF